MTDHDDTDPVESTPAGSGTTTAAARRAAVAGLRLATGIVGVAASVAAVAAVGLVAVPDVGRAAPASDIRPVASELTRLCPGSLLTLGSDGGADAATAASVGRPTVSVSTVKTNADQTTLTPSATDAQVLQAAPADGALLSGAQTQSVSNSDLLGLAATSCREPAGTSWLVGGSTTTGRTTLVTLSNPTEVAATVELRLWGEQGIVDAPGLAGIVVDPGGQRVVSLSGYAQNLASPVVEVISRGGRVVATMQESIIRTLDPGGVELTGEGAAPATSLTIPGVRILAPQNVGALLGLDDYADARTVLRLLAPTADTRATIVIRPVGGGDAKTSEVPLTEGTVLDVPLDDLTAGNWTVTVSADAPVVGAVRASTANPLTGKQFEAPVSDLAWFGSAEPLAGATSFTVPTGSGSVLTLANPSRSARTAELVRDGRPTQRVAVPAGASVQVTLNSGGYRLTGAAGLVAGVSQGGNGQLAAWALASARPVSGDIVIRR